MKSSGMHWVLQSNLLHEGHANLVAALERAGASFSEHKVVPFSGDIIPDISVENPVIVVGTHSMCHLAERKKWVPGHFDASKLSWTLQAAKWGSFLLNIDAVLTTFAAASPDLELFFLRPCGDRKEFAGCVMDRGSLVEWQHKVLALKEDDGSTLVGETLVLWAPVKDVRSEHRFWIVDGEVVTGTRYPKPSADILEEAAEFCREMIRKFNPLRAFVMDVCLSDGEFKIVEINTMNSAGFYAADLDRLVRAIEAMKWGESK